MVDEGVAEALHHGIGEVHQLVMGKVQGRHELIVHHTMHEAAYDGVLAGIAYDVDAGEECHRRQHRMGTIEQRHLALMVRRLTGDEQHIQSGSVGGELGLNTTQLSS